VPGANGPGGLDRSDIVRAADWVSDGAPGTFNRNICNVSVGVGDGSLLCLGGAASGTNRDDLYVLYTQYGSTDSLDLADSSHFGLQNGNLYLTVSPAWSRFWSKGVCLTTIDSIGGRPTRSPGCEWWGALDYCRSEHLGTIDARVSSIAHIAYAGDLNAGSTPYDDAGWPFSYFMYLRLSGDTTRILCPEVSCWDSLSCGISGDLTQDSATDVFDVVLNIDIAFSGVTPMPSPPGCPWDLSDVDCDGATDVFDVIALIDYVFQGGANLPNPCACHQTRE
jgi:hypothetical protein